MTAWLKDYIFTIISISFITLIIDCIIPNGNLKRYAIFGISVILSIALISPFNNLIKKDFKLEIPENTYFVDYTSAVKNTVNSIKGFEDASVSVKQENNKIISITVYLKKERVLEDAVENLTGNFVKKMLSTVYNVDENNIFFRSE